MRWLHLSDIHYNPEIDGSSSRQLRDKLVKYLRENHIRVDNLFVTGDYRHALFQDDTDEVAQLAVNFIRDIAESIGIKDSDDIHVIPGNHDLDRGRNKKTLENALIGYTPDIGRWESGDLEKLIERFSFFKRVNRLLNRKTPIWPDKLLPLHTYCCCDGYSLLYMNTAIACGSDKDRGNLVIGNDYMLKALNCISRENPEAPIIILAHHGMELMHKAEREAMEAIFRDYPIALYLCGDTHVGWHRKINDIHEVTMGCIKQDKGVQVMFSEGELKEKASRISSLFAHRWDTKERAWGRYTQFNSILPLSTEADDETINEHRDQVKNNALLPWMKNSVGLRHVFPDLFIPPIATASKNKTEITFSHLTANYLDKNTVILGLAGAGKTTLLRYMYSYFEPKDISHVFLYINANSLLGSPETKYDLLAHNVLDNRKCFDKNVLLLIDGIDEAFLNQCDEFMLFLQKISMLDHCSIWLGCRTDYFNSLFTAKSDQFFYDYVTLKPWSIEQADQFITIYSKRVDCPEIVDRIERFIESNKNAAKFKENPFQLTLLVYLMENSEANHRYTINSLYDLYREFLECWIEKERVRGTSHLKKNRIYDNLYHIAKKVYYGEAPAIRSNDSAIIGLLNWNERRNTVVEGFYHRSLSAYFLANHVFKSLQMGGKRLISDLSQWLLDDVTNFVTDAFKSINKVQQNKIAQNINRIYRQISEKDQCILNEKEKQEIGKLDEHTILILKDELLYFMTRLDKLDVTEFVEYAYSKETHPIIQLNIAYGAVLLSAPHPIALEYAKKLFLIP